MNIGEKIRKLRIEKNLTQKQLAEMAGIAEITVRQYESGKRMPKLIPLLGIADALQVSAYELEGIPAPKNDDGKISFKDPNGNVTLKVDPLELQKVANKMAGIAHPNKTSILVASFEKLNYKGQNEALRQIKLLTKVPEYQINPDKPVLNAAHADDYTNAPEELKQLEESIMDDENF